MTKDDMIKVALKWYDSGAEDMQEFADMVSGLLDESAKSEREACAKIAETFVWFEAEGCGPDEGNVFIARAIRERSNVKVTGLPQPAGGSDTTNADCGRSG